MRRLGVRSRKGIAQAIRWTLSTPSGWWFLAARVAAVVTAIWVNNQYGETPAIITLVIAIIVAGLIAPPAPDMSDSERGPPTVARGTE